MFLVDCQGTGDTKQNNAQLDTLIFYISLQMSCVQLVNLPRLMTSQDLTSLQVGSILLRYWFHLNLSFMIMNLRRWHSKESVVFFYFHNILGALFYMTNQMRLRQLMC